MFTCEFHNDAEDIDALVEESLLVGYDGWGLDGSQNSDFVESIFLFFGVELVHFDFF